MPHHQRVRANIDEVLDLDMIQQQAEHGLLDFQHYARFIIDKMAALCAPVRDELVASLRDITDIVTLYRYEMHSYIIICVLSCRTGSI